MLNLNGSRLAEAQAFYKLLSHPDNFPTSKRVEMYDDQRWERMKKMGMSHSDPFVLLWFSNIQPEHELAWDAYATGWESTRHDR